ncbi:MAG: hypothetical protein ABUL44_03360, partial [Flavobacterium sp.]
MNLQTLSKASIEYISTDKAQGFLWGISVAIKIFCKGLRLFIKNNVTINSYSFDRRSWLASYRLNHFSGRPQMIIAHNPSVFFPAFRYAQKNKIVYGIDIEDYHPGETASKQEEQQLISIMNGALKDAAYLSYASPLIKAEVNKILKTKCKNEVVVNNFFPANNFNFTESAISSKLEFVWFSQHIDYGRGIENIIQAFSEFSDSLDLVLFGELNKRFYESVLKERSFVTIRPPLSLNELNHEVCKYDVGLAIEPGRNLNNDIALSNKILTYFQAGLFIMASRT